MSLCVAHFFFNDTATTEIYTLSLHDALPIWPDVAREAVDGPRRPWVERAVLDGQVGEQATQSRELLVGEPGADPPGEPKRSEEHTSELQSRQYIVCGLLL